MRLCPLSSGSKGNCTFIESGNQRILIDAGLSGKMTEARLSDIDVPIDSITAVLITHEHSDHVGGAGVLARKYGLPIYIHPQTYKHTHHRIFKGDEKITFWEKSFDLGSVKIDPIELSHDAAYPVAYKLSSKNKRIGIVTDLGIPTHLVRVKMKDCHALVLEMNHDPKMLMNSTKYPWELKQRILGNYGHLSNEAGANLFNDIVTENTSHVFLAHLSEENNSPHLARETLEQINAENPWIQKLKIHIAKQHQISELVEI